MKKSVSTILFLSLVLVCSAKGRLRDYGICPGIFKTGEYNAITDVNGVRVGHVTIIEGEDIRTGVTAIIPHEGSIYKKKCPAAVFIANGFGKMAGYPQVKELGNIETPVVLTNTLSVPQAVEALITYTIKENPNENITSVNSFVGETNDYPLNNIAARRITQKDVLNALNSAKTGPVAEGSVGAGTGTQFFKYKGGIGTSSRVLPKSLGGYTVGVLVQTNYSGVLEVNGYPVGKEMGTFTYDKHVVQKDDHEPDGSCYMVLITDAPLDARGLDRLAKRMFMGLAKTGSFATNGSGDFCVAISVCKENLIDENTEFYYPTLLHNASMSPLFEAALEATEEALWNAGFAGEDMVGYKGYKRKALPVDEVVELMKKPFLK